MSIAPQTHSVVAVFDARTAAEKAVKELLKAGFDMKNMSIVPRGDHSEEHVAIGYFNYERAMKENKFLIVADATVDVLGQARDMLSGPDSVDIKVYTDQDV
jgi:hypothetical protein